MDKSGVGTLKDLRGLRRPPLEDSEEMNGYLTPSQPG